MEATQEKSETKTPAAEPQTADAAKTEAAAESEPTYAFPDASRGAVLHIDKATGTLWLGFKLTGFDYQEAVLWLDSKKLDILRIYKQIAAAMQEREALGDPRALKPKPKGGILDMMGRLAGRGR